MGRKLHEEAGCLVNGRQLGSLGQRLVGGLGQPPIAPSFLGVKDLWLVPVAVSAWPSTAPPTDARCLAYSSRILIEATWPEAPAAGPGVDLWPKRNQSMSHLWNLGS